MPGHNYFTLIYLVETVQLFLIEEPVGIYRHLFGQALINNSDNLALAHNACN